MSKPLPPFDPDTECPACQYPEMDTNFIAYGRCIHDAHRGNQVFAAHGDVRSNPRLCRTCPRCGYSLDQATRLPQPDDATVATGTP